MDNNQSDYKNLKKREPGHTYWVMGSRSAWDNVLIGLFYSKQEVDRGSSYPFGKTQSIARPATEMEVDNFFNKKA
jgi:hypothetical protein